MLYGVTMATTETKSKKHEDGDIESEKEKEKKKKETESKSKFSSQENQRRKDKNKNKEEKSKTQEDRLREELEKVKENNDKYNSNLNRPEIEPFVPYIFNSLQPYTDTRLIETAINEPPELQHHPVCRNTALGHCDPWVDLRMDTEIPCSAPSTARDPSKYYRSKTKKSHGTARESKKKNESESDKESTSSDSDEEHFPTVTPRPSRFYLKQIHYGQVPKIREELRRTYSAEADRKIEEDYRRTKKYFYSRELDKMDDYRSRGKVNMRASYFAYLQNSPGSKKALYECVRQLDEAEKKGKRDRQTEKKTEEEENSTTDKTKSERKKKEKDKEKDGKKRKNNPDTKESSQRNKTSSDKNRNKNKGGESQPNALKHGSKNTGTKNKKEEPLTKEDKHKK